MLKNETYKNRELAGINTRYSRVQSDVREQMSLARVPRCPQAYKDKLESSSHHILTRLPCLASRGASLKGKLITRSISVK